MEGSSINKNVFNDVEVCGILYKPPSHEAAQRGVVGGAGKCDLEETNFLGETALHVAAKFGSRNVIKALSKAGINVNKRDVMGQTALFHATDLLTVKVLRGIGVDFAAQDLSGKVAAYYFARGKGMEEIAQYTVRVMVLDNSEMEMPTLPNKKIKQYWIECASEKKIIQKEHVGGGGANYTLYDVITAKDSSNLLSIFASSNAKDMDGYTSKLHIYCDEMKTQYLKGKQRIESIDSVVDMFQSKFNLPPEMSHKICRYIDDSSLASLLKVQLADILP